MTDKKTINTPEHKYAQASASPNTVSEITNGELAEGIGVNGDNGNITEERTSSAHEVSREKREVPEKKSTLAKVGSIISGVVTALLLILIAVLIFSLFSNRDGNGVKVGPYKSLTVVTGSMVPTLKPGDLIVIKTVSADEVAVDDIITFSLPSDEYTYVTHRVVEMKEGPAFVTRGDANNTNDATAVTPDRLVGKYCFKISGFGNLFAWMTSMTGIIIIAAIFVAYCIIEAVVKEVLKKRSNAKKSN